MTKFDPSIDKRQVCTIYLVRHGQTEANRDQLISGHLDTPLTDTGREQAAGTSEELKHIRFDEVYSSDLQRAVHTAEIIAGKPVPKANRLYALRERNFGELEGHPDAHYKELRSNHAHLPLREQWESKFGTSMESDREVGERGAIALQEIARANLEKTVLVVAHGGLIRTLMEKIGHLKIGEMTAGTFRNGGYAELLSDGETFQVNQLVGRMEKPGAE